MDILIAQLNPTIGALDANRKKIEGALDQARTTGAQLLVTSEMALCGYPPEDLLLLPDFVAAVEHQLQLLLPSTHGLVALIGTIRPSPHGVGKPLCDTVAICQDGQLLGFQDKTLLPTYDVFDEARYFEPAPTNNVWLLCGQRIAITVCEDIWGAQSEVRYARDPLQQLAEQQPTLLINLSASPYSIEKRATRLQVLSQASQRLGCPGLLVNQVGANDSLIFDGHSLLCGADGLLRAQAAGFAEEICVWDPFSPAESIEPARLPVEELYQALILGVRDFFHKQGFSQAVLGLSGGIDSAVVAAIAAQALGPENVLGVSLPSRFTSAGSRADAPRVAQALGIRFEEMSIEPLFTVALEALDPAFATNTWDSTEENLQARIRGLLLMALSNKQKRVLLNTGNKSEMAMGYFTLYGDGAGGLAVLSDVTKEQVYHLARHIQSIPQSVLDRAPSAELRPNQKDSDSLPPYSVLDAVVSLHVEHHLPARQVAQSVQTPLATVEGIIRTIHATEFKRRQTPIGLRVTPKAFSKGRQFPIVQKFC
jgi:NAD+ synthase (glutamine-hydrolysing)